MSRPPSVVGVVLWAACLGLGSASAAARTLQQRVCSSVSRGGVDAVDRVHGIGCDEALVVAHLFVRSSDEFDAEDGRGGTYRFWYGYRTPRWIRPRASDRRNWTCRVPASNLTADCQAEGAGFRLWTGDTTGPNCGPATFDDRIDGSVIVAGDWIQRGGLSCRAEQARARAFYRQGLDARRGARHRYTVYGGWTCTSWDVPTRHEDASALDAFQCVGEPFPRSTLPEEIYFDLEPPVVQVSCAGGVCTESYPADHRDYGNVSDRARGGLSIQRADRGNYGVVPAVGHYSWAALCTWQDQGSTDGGRTEGYNCGYPGAAPALATRR